MFNTIETPKKIDTKVNFTPETDFTNKESTARTLKKPVRMFFTCIFIVGVGCVAHSLDCALHKEQSPSPDTTLRLTFVLHGDQSINYEMHVAEYL